MRRNTHWDNRLWTVGGYRNWCELADLFEPHVKQYDIEFATHRVAYVVSNHLEALIVVAGALRHDLDFMVIPRERCSTPMEQRLALAGFSVYVVCDNLFVSTVAVKGEPGRITLITSGTTGEPKFVEHSWLSINTFDRVKPGAKYDWIVPYQVGTYAWFQMVALSISVSEQGLIPMSTNDLTHLFEEAVIAGASAISSTPTFWRMAFMQIEESLIRRIRLRQITLGGEVVDQKILDALRMQYPMARVSHIFASSEVGACIVVNDGLAGFPAKLLQHDDTRTWQIRIDQGELWVRSRYAASDVIDWINTGDLVTHNGDRIFFVGRSDQTMINIGGNKAYPGDIERLLLSHPNLIWCRVYAHKAPLLGYLAAADVCLRPGCEITEAEKILTQYCEIHLPDYAVPRIWQFLDNIPVTDNLKAELKCVQNRTCSAR